MAAVALKRVAVYRKQQSANAVGVGTFYAFGHQCPGSGISLPPFHYNSYPTSLLSPSCNQTMSH